jgi:hypothetical protein
MLVAAPASAATPTTERSVTRMGRSKRWLNLELDLHARLKKADIASETALLRVRFSIDDPVQFTPRIFSAS